MVTTSLLTRMDEVATFSPLRYVEMNGADGHAVSMKISPGGGQGLSLGFLHGSLRIPLEFLSGIFGYITKIL